jgi:hypothetical protein
MELLDLVDIKERLLLHLVLDLLKRIIPRGLSPGGGSGALRGSGIIEELPLCLRDVEAAKLGDEIWGDVRDDGVLRLPLLDFDLMMGDWRSQMDFISVEGATGQMRV